jgi:DUF1365 family protein
VSTSCLYRGTVRHHRRHPAVEFRYPLELAYIDLAELPLLLGGRLTRDRKGLLRFRRRDYLGGGSGQPLEETVRGLVAERTGRRPEGPIRLLTALRTFGTLFNPVSFYYCFDASGQRLQALIAEVTNTPWGERHAYVLEPDGQAESGVLHARFAKELHVSPFMAMDYLYTCHATAPAETLSVHVESEREGESAFDAILSLRRGALTPATARRHLLRYPFAGLRVLALIYSRALRLKLAGAPYFRHPQARPA